MITDTYSPSLALLTDLYQLTMGYGYWRHKMHDRRAVFHLFFRRCPFDGQYAIAAGLAPAVEWLRTFQVSQGDVEYLATLCGNDDKPLFDEPFLDAINGMSLDVDLDGIPEGTVVYAHEPLVRVTGPLWQCQWIETALLNMINFQTLIATKSSRVCDAAGGDSVLEFGLRRAQGIDGALSATRAAYIGGCHATSNVLAGRLLGIPVKGTHAHSWVMSFDDESESFEAYAEAMPNNCVFLVDTYDTVEGVRSAIRVGATLREHGHEMVGVRLDSGDLARLSIQARTLLDEAGFPDAAIVASNDLDETAISNLKAQGARISVWGVGTKLITAYDQPALGGVYKLAAIQKPDGTWTPKVKLSEQAIKTSIPGMQQVRRFRNGPTAVADMIYNELDDLPDDPSIIQLDGKMSHPAGKQLSYEDLLIPVIRDGQTVFAEEDLATIRDRTRHQLNGFDEEIKRIADPASFPVGLEQNLHRLKADLIEQAQRGHAAK